MKNQLTRPSTSMTLLDPPPPPLPLLLPTVIVRPEFVLNIISDMSILLDPSMLARTLCYV